MYKNSRNSTTSSVGGGSGGGSGPKPYRSRGVRRLPPSLPPSLFPISFLEILLSTIQSLGTFGEGRVGRRVGKE